MDSDQRFSRFDGDLLVEIGVSRLAHVYFVLARQKKDLLVAFEFAYVADVLAVDPDAGAFFNFCGGNEVDFSHDLVIVGVNSRGRK